jgi:hypothetical protein
MLPGLQVAMDHAFFVCIIQRVGHLLHDVGGFVETHRAALDALRQRRPLDHFHHKVIGTNVEQCADIGMVQRGDDLGFSREPLAESLLGGFDGDLARQARVGGAVDLAHAALADDFRDLIVIEAVARFERHMGRIVS